MALSLQTSARRKGNAFVTARVGLASNGISSRYGAHVRCSGYLEFKRNRCRPKK